MDNFNILGTDMFGDDIVPESPTNKRFVFPPFTVLDAKSGEWQERKRLWKSLGIEAEVAREVSGAHAIADARQHQTKDGKPYGVFGERMLEMNQGASIFDPVICELAYMWFSPKGGQIIDPFAGGSVRGIVAKSLNRKYWGSEIRAEQVLANTKQAENIFPGYDGETDDFFGGPDLVWICGDSMETLNDAPEADFVFTCPPYGDLEVYSDEPGDLSNMEYHTFLAAYKRIIFRACKKLKNDRFACFVIGDFRDKKTGAYRNFVSETINAFLENGLMLYNEAIVATPVGTACLRVGNQFDSNRKMVKTHQNILVFAKGDPKIAASLCK